MAVYHVDLYNGDDSNDGLSWATALKTLQEAGSRLVNYDEVKISKTPDPFSIGNAEWNYGDDKIIIQPGLTKSIEDCSSAWTPSPNVSASTNTSYKAEGNAGAYIYVYAGFSTGKKPRPMETKEPL